MIEFLTFFIFRGVQRSQTASLLNKVTVVKSPISKFKKFAPDTTDSAPSTPMQFPEKKPSTMSRFSSFAPESDSTVSTTPKPAVKTLTKETPKAQPAVVKAVVTPFEQFVGSIEKAVSADSDKRKDQFKALNNFVANSLKFKFSVTEFERVFSVYRQNLNDQSPAVQFSFFAFVFFFFVFNYFICIFVCIYFFTFFILCLCVFYSRSMSWCAVSQSSSRIPK